MYLSNARKVVAVRDVNLKESDVGSIHDKTETSDLLSEGLTKLGMWQPDDVHQDDGQSTRKTRHIN